MSQWRMSAWIEDKYTEPVEIVAFVGGDYSAWAIYRSGDRLGSIPLDQVRLADGGTEGRRMSDGPESESELVRAVDQVYTPIEEKADEFERRLVRAFSNWLVHSRLMARDDTGPCENVDHLLEFFQREGLRVVVR